MKKAGVFVLFVAVVFALASEVFAQQTRRGCWGRADLYNRLYNPDTVVSISGTVADIEYFTPAAGMSQGVHLLLRQPNGALAEVHLGPRWYLDNQDMRINEGDAIEVTGSQVDFEGQPVIIASTVRMDGQTLRLRDRQGFPLWAGWRRSPE